MLNMADLKVKLSVIDATKTQLEKAKNNFKGLAKNFGDVFKKENEKTRKDNEKTFRKMSEDSRKYSKSSRTGTGAGAGTGGQAISVLESINREDIALMNAIREKGTSLRNNSRANNKFSAPSNNSDSISNQVGGAFGNSRNVSVNEMKVGRLVVGGMGGGGIYNANAGQQQPQINPEDLKKSGGMSKLGKFGTIAGIIMASMGAAYGIVSARAGAYRNMANQQIGGLQSMGFGANEAGGFYRGIRNSDYSLTGAQRVSMMSAYANQTGAGRGTLEGLATGENNLAMYQNAYGFDPSMMGEQAGTFARFGGGTKGFQKTMQGAHNVGMSQTAGRSQEFIKAMQEALTQAVYSGSKRSFDDLNDSLQVLMKGSDERLKVLAPQIMAGSTASMQQAALFQGGDQESAMYQAVFRQRQQAGEDTSPAAIQEQLSMRKKGDWLKTMQAQIKLKQEQFGIGDDNVNYRTALASIPGMPKDVFSALDVSKNIMSGKVESKDSMEQYVQSRLDALRPSLQQTQQQDVRESVNTLTDANSKAAFVVNEFRDNLEKGVDYLANGLIKTTDKILKIIDDIKKHGEAQKHFVPTGTDAYTDYLKQQMSFTRTQ